MAVGWLLLAYVFSISERAEATPVA
jgi:hypothetical protein